MCSNEIGKADGIVAIVSEEQLEWVYHDQYELNHLQHSQIFLPPQVFLDLGTHCSQHIVCVHNNMHKGIKETEEGRMAARCEFNTPPNRYRHNAMMYNMQCRNLIITFAHHKEECIKEFGEFWKEVPPATTRRL